jgi:hypothetical protein
MPGGKVRQQSTAAKSSSCSPERFELVLEAVQGGQHGPTAMARPIEGTATNRGLGGSCLAPS